MINIVQYAMKSQIDEEAQYTVAFAMSTCKYQILISTVLYSISKNVRRIYYLFTKKNRKFTTTGIVRSNQNHVKIQYELRLVKCVITEGAAKIDGNSP
jgi:hypothetical protein